MYKSLHDCILDLEHQGELIRIKEEVNPYLEMSSIHLKIYEQQGPAILFENIKGCRYQSVSNLFGTKKRAEYLFRNSIKPIQQLIEIKNNPASVFNKPFSKIKLLKTALASKPKRISDNSISEFEAISINDLPLIHHWKNDGGAFITLPQVYTEDPDNCGINNSNLGMYRVQLNGNQYLENKEIGMHYQLHRGIGIHHTKAKNKNQKLKVSIFVGGPPSHSLAAVMPLPEGMSEINFAGAIGQNRFRYFYHNGYCISADADFVINGTIESDATKPEGPFGDHLGYYSLTHDFPVLKVEHVWAKKNAIWPFTVVGRPPQEDTSFGHLIHLISGKAIQKEISGVKEVHAVDVAGVHPLLLAIGSERYTPYLNDENPAELLTQANRILGTGQLSLAKFLFIQSETNDLKNCHDPKLFIENFLMRFNPENDLHFYTKTTIDTLDYSGEKINAGSKLVLAAHGTKKRNLGNSLPEHLKNSTLNFKIVAPGILAFNAETFKDYNKAEIFFQNLEKEFLNKEKIFEPFPLWIACDDSSFIAENYNNFLWAVFTRTNPSHDVYGINSSTKYKHWSCKGPLIFDARIKPHHAPELKLDEATEKNIQRFFQKNASLEKFKY